MPKNIEYLYLTLGGSNYIFYVDPDNVSGGYREYISYLNTIKSKAGSDFGYITSDVASLICGIGKKDTQDPAAKAFSSWIGVMGFEPGSSQNAHSVWYNNNDNYYEEKEWQVLVYHQFDLEDTELGWNELSREEMMTYLKNHGGMLPSNDEIKIVADYDDRDMGVTINGMLVYCKRLNK